ILVGYSADGEVLLDHCILKYAGGNWGGWNTYNAPIIVNLGANAEISNSELSYSRLYGIRIENATGTIRLTDNVIKNNGGHGIFSKNGSPSIDGNSITDNGGYGLYVEGTALPGNISENDFEGNKSGSIVLAAKASGTSIEADNAGVEGIWVGGAISDDTTWGSSFPYIISGDLHVVAGKTLTIKPGMVIKVKSGFRILIDGTLDARGTAEKKIYFTDFRDDTAGGDTNGDGNATAPAAAGWSSIIVGYSANGEALFDHCILKYAGGNWGGWNTYNAPIIINIGANAEISNSELSYSRLYGVRMENGTGDINLTNNTIKNNGSHGIYSKNSSPSISGNSFTGNGGYGLYVEGAALPGGISGNTFGTNTSGSIGLGTSAAGTSIGADNAGAGGIWLLGGSISVDTVLGSAFPYIINTDVVVNEGFSLTILPGAILKFNGPKYLRVFGNLEATGNADQSIYFTSYHDDDQNASGDTNGNGSATLPENNKWCGIRFEGAGAGKLDYGILRYAGESWGYGYGSSHNSAVTILTSGTIAMKGCDIGYSRVHGLRIDSASGTVSLENSSIHDNPQYGIHMKNSTATITVDHCMIFENTEGQVSLSNTPNLTIRNTTAAALSASVAPGTADGSTCISAASGSGNHLVVKVSSSAPDEPVLLSPEPSGDGVVNSYTAGADILGVDSSTNKYLAVYEANAEGKILRFRPITLSANDIYNGALSEIWASNVSISGSAVEGEVLTGSYDFHRAEAEESGTSFRWLRISADETTVFTNENIGGVGNGPSADTVFTIGEDTLISSIQNYHWNYGQGSSPVGEISLRDLDGRIFGPWQAQGLAGYMGVHNAYWVVSPQIVLPAGTYTIVDSDPATWSQNGESGYQGFTHVKTVTSEEIIGASGPNYQVTSADVGYRLQFEVTVQDGDGTIGKPAASDAIGPVIEKPEENKAPVIAADWNYSTVYFGMDYPYSITVTDEENTPNTKIYSSLDNGDYSIACIYPAAPGLQLFSLSPLRGVLGEGDHNLRYYAVDSEGAASQVLMLTFRVADPPDTPDPRQMC
ncbi:MAG: hypothetical protein K0Q48_1958, partial [Bacillota bacterium]|nr:hypothetical protein [Bacillota bacterium]